MIFQNIPVSFSFLFFFSIEKSRLFRGFTQLDIFRGLAGMKSAEFIQQGLTALPPVGVRDTRFLGTYDRTFGNLKKTDTFGAPFRIDDVGLLPLANGLVGTMLLAIAAHDAIFSDHICHSLIFSLPSPGHYASGSLIAFLAAIMP